jgi:hypothetical protein
MGDGRIQKEIFYGEIQIGKRFWARFLYFGTEICKSRICTAQTENYQVAFKQSVIDRIAWSGKIRNGIVVKIKVIGNRSETRHLRGHIRLEGPSSA